MEFTLNQIITREQLGDAFIFVNKHNEISLEQWDVVAIGMYSWQIVLATVPTEKQIKENRIIELQQFLDGTDYITDKIVDGSATLDDYAETIEKRKAARIEIHNLRLELQQGE